MKKFKLSSSAMLAIAMGLAFGPAGAVVIDNDKPTTELGYWAVDVLGGGESFDGRITAIGTPSGTTFEASNVIYYYASFVDVGAGGVQLSATTGPTLSGDDEVTSSGTFAGAAGNTIAWSVSSTIPADSPTMTSTFTFTAETGALGSLRFHQYLDEDVIDTENIFFTRGSTAAGDLELFTVDDTEAFGVSQSGALQTGQGLVNSNFSGWAACEFSTLVNAIISGTQTVSPTGEVCAGLASLPINHPVVGPALGPLDVGSTVAWDVDPNETTATIITTMGGVPEAPPPASDFTKTITEGPDEDNNNEIDVVIGVKQTTTTAYQWKINYNQPELVLITDTAPAESVVTAVNDDLNDLPLGCGDAASFDHDSGDVDVSRGGKQGKKCHSATQFSWMPDSNDETLVVDVEMRMSPGKGHKEDAYAPTSCGALYLNDGAKAYELDPETGQPLLDESGEWLPPIYESNQLCVAAVKEPTAFGPDADNDADGIYDIDEACNNEVKTDPCLADSDGDGVIDGLDSCPLEGPANTDVGETLGADGCIIYPI